MEELAQASFATLRDINQLFYFNDWLPTLTHLERLTCAKFLFGKLESSCNLNMTILDSTSLPSLAQLIYI